MLNLVKVYLVEIGQPEKYEELRAIAHRYHGVYHSAVRKVAGSSFLFTKEADAAAFIERASGWPQYKEKHDA